MSSIWRNRDFVVLWLGRLVSTLGSGISAIALPLMVLFLTRSPAKAGAVAAASGAPYFLLSVPAGVLVDRWNRRAVLIVSDLGRAIAWTTVGLAVATHHATLALLVVVAICEGTFFVFHNIAMSAILPRVVASDQLPSAVAQNSVIVGTSDLLGPAIGGAVFQLSHAVPFLVDGVSYVASIAAIATIRTPLSAERGTKHSSVLDDAAEGLRFVLTQKALRVLTIVGGIGDLLFSGIALALIVDAQRRAHATALAIGLIFATASVAGMIGAVAAPRILARLDVGWTFLVTAVVGAVVFSLIVSAASVVAIAIVWGLNVMVLEVANVARQTFDLRITPDAMRGRVAGLVDLVSNGGLPVGMALAGFALAAWGPTSTLAAMAVGRVFLTLVLIGSRSVREASFGQAPT